MNRRFCPALLTAFGHFTPTETLGVALSFGPRRRRNWACALAAVLWFAPALVRATDPPIAVAISCSSHGDISPKGDLILPALSDLDVSATPEPGYEIQDWYVNGDSAGWGDIRQQHFAFGNLDVSIRVVFQRLTNLVHAMAGSSGELAPGGDNGTVAVGWGDSLTFTATPQPHYHVEAWTLDDDLAQTGGATFTVAGVKAEHWLLVTFAPDTYTVQAGAGSHGNLSPTGAVQVVFEDNQSFTATPDAHCEVAVWRVDGRPVQTNGSTFTLFDVATNHTLQVTFVAPELALTRTATNSVVVSWPASLEGWQLQENATLTPAQWTDVSRLPQEVNGRNQVIVAPPAGNRFYRLLEL